jgi:hypothetical protein
MELAGRGTEFSSVFPALVLALLRLENSRIRKTRVGGNENN